MLSPLSLSLSLPASLDLSFESSLIELVHVGLGSTVEAVISVWGVFGRSVASEPKIVFQIVLPFVFSISVFFFNSSIGEVVEMGSCVESDSRSFTGGCHFHFDGTLPLCFADRTVFLLGAISCKYNYRAEIRLYNKYKYTD